MKKILFLLLSTVFIWQSCDTKTAEVNTSGEIAQQDSIVKADDLAAKRAWLIKAGEEKAEQRRLAAIEKANLSPTYQDASGRIVYVKTEVAPYYEGGEDAMLKYLNDNLIYPETAKEQNKEGIVFVDFVIDQDGNVREVVASDVVGEDVDLMLKEESVRVVASMPGWKAGIQQGKPVDASFSIPIRFVLN
ncbi:MAG: energy transducer TonB [Candidatus Cyclobacteriaceae bacterium M2_1C_046]